MSAASHDRSGAVLVFALLLLVVGALVLGGVGQLAATQARAGETEWEASLRRIRVDNSRAMARQYLLVNMFRGSAPLPATNASDWGGFVLYSANTNDWWKAVSATNSDLKINPFSLLERGGFYRVLLDGFLWDGSLQSNGKPTNKVEWRFLVRTRSPIAAGYSAIGQRPNGLPWTPTNAAIDFTKGKKFFGYDALPRFPVSSVTNTYGSETNGYAGYFDIDIDLPSGITNGYTNVQTNALVPGVSMQVVVNLNDATAAGPPIPIFRFAQTDNTAAYVTTGPNGLPETNYVDITQLVLAGAPAGAGYDPVFIYLPTNQTTISSIVLSNGNRRMVYVARKEGNNLTISAVNAGSSPWRLGLTYAAPSRTLTFSGTPPIEGGFRTDALVLGSPDLRGDADPARLDSLADRMMWLEDNRKP